MYLVFSIILIQFHRAIRENTVLTVIVHPIEIKSYLLTYFCRCGFYFPQLICGFVCIDCRIEMMLNPRSGDSWLVGYLLGLYMNTYSKVFITKC